MALNFDTTLPGLVRPIPLDSDYLFVCSSLHRISARWKDNLFYCVVAKIPKKCRELICIRERGGGGQLRCGTHGWYTPRRTRPC